MKNVIITLEGTKSNIEATQFIGSWIQPNPINDKEVQGFILKNDGTAQSINYEVAKINAKKLDLNNT